MKTRGGSFIISSFNLQFVLKYYIASPHLSSLFLVLLWADIRFNVELHEKEEKRKDVNNVGTGNAKRKGIASLGNKVSSLRHHCNELDQLKKSKV